MWKLGGRREERSGCEREQIIAGQGHMYIVRRDQSGGMEQHDPYTSQGLRFISCHAQPGFTPISIALYGHKPASSDLVGTRMAENKKTASTSARGRSVSVGSTHSISGTLPFHRTKRRQNIVYLSEQSNTHSHLSAWNRTEGPFSPAFW